MIYHHNSIWLQSGVLMQRTMVSVIRSISCLSLVLCCLNGLRPIKSLYSTQPKENQSALESYGVFFESTSGAMYPCVPLLQNKEFRALRYTSKNSIGLRILHIHTRSRAVSSLRNRMPIPDPISWRDRVRPAVCSRAWDHDRRCTCGACAPGQGSFPRRKTSLPARWRLRVGLGGNANRRRSLDPIWSTACRRYETHMSCTRWMGSPPAVIVLRHVMSHHRHRD